MSDSEILECWAVIGGSGLYEMPGFDLVPEQDTPYGRVSGLSCGTISGKKVYFLPRHGGKHQIPPHKINYRANVWALNSLAVKNIIAVNAVGGINPLMGPGHLIVPDQVIDYSYGREHTFSDGSGCAVQHVDFTNPFCEVLRGQILCSARKIFSVESYSDFGTYGCTQGPRLESAAEVARLQRDGCDLVGMTLMPEAALARELGINYASICAVANWGAGIDSQPLTMALILETLSCALKSVRVLINSALAGSNSQNL